MRLFGRKPKIKIVEDHNWMRPECKQGCPYFADDEESKILQCIRPFGEPCIADAALTQVLFRKK